MKFWDESLRICPKCKQKVNLDGKGRQPCPKCGAQVFFYDYRKLPDPPPIPQLPRSDFWGNPGSVVLLCVFALLSLLALLSFTNVLIPSIFCALVAAGFVVFAMIRHSEAIDAEMLC